jgi:hypothetical protein
MNGGMPPSGSAVIFIRITDHLPHAFQVYALACEKM